MLGWARLEHIAEGQVFLVGQIQEALLDAFQPGAAVGGGDVDPSVLLVRLEVGVDLDPRVLVDGWVRGAQLRDALIALAVLLLEVPVERENDHHLRAPRGHQDRPGHGVPRLVLLLPGLWREHLPQGVTNEPDPVHGQLFGVAGYSGRHPGDRHDDGWLAAEFWRRRE